MKRMLCLNKAHIKTTFIRYGIFNLVFESCNKNFFKVDEEEENGQEKQVIKQKDFI
jgi:hypothetical protein